MNQHLLLHLSQSYARIKTRGAIWKEAFAGGWYSDYSGKPHEKFLARFDPSLQRKIKLLAGDRADPIDIPASAVISILYPHT